MNTPKLTLPFVDGKRHPIIHDRVLYYPQRGVADFDFPGWQSEALFGNDNPIHVEYCSGNGAWIAAKASAHPEKNWIAVEKKFMRVRKIWAKIKKFQLSNLIVVSGAAEQITEILFPDDSVEAVYINFPDPWPKKRHEKHRITHPLFLRAITRILKTDGKFTFVTDDPPFSSWTSEQLKTVDRLSSLHPDPFYITELPGYGTSYFEDLWRSQGKTIHYHQYRAL